MIDTYNTFVNVKTGEELQKALDDEFIRVIILEEGEYNLKNDNVITISKNEKIVIGNENTVFTSCILIKADTVLNGIKFLSKDNMTENKCNIFIENNAEVQLVNIRINNQKLTDIKGIVMKNNSNSILHMYDSIISNVKIAIEVNSDNILGNIINNKFVDFIEGISSLKKGASIKCIKNNIFKSKNNGIDISFSTGVNIYIDEKLLLVTDGIKFAREICLNNNYAFVKGFDIFNDIATKYCEVKNYDELCCVLQKCNTGNIIILKKGLYYGNIVLDKQVALIGEKPLESIIVPKDNYNTEDPENGIIISSDNVLIKDIRIDGKGNYKLNNYKCNFRDGIRYVGDNLNNNEFVNVNIKNIQRRGISIWPEDTSNTLIENCIIENIEKQSCIYFNGSGIIQNCILKKASIGIQASNCYEDEKLIINSNVILNNMDSIIIEDTTPNKIEVLNNHLINNGKDIQYKNSLYI